MTERYHSGEREIQQRTGESDRALLHSRGIGGSIPAGAYPFLRNQQYCVLAWVSPEGEVWSCFVTAPLGFATVDADGTELVMELGEDNTVLQSIPPMERMREGDHVGVLFVEFATRRRLRVNGKAAEVSSSRLRIAVAEAFANCPKYIQRRVSGQQVSQREGIAAHPVLGQGLSEELVRWITEADTVFVASAHPNGPADASHRGGTPGFIRVRGGELFIPDYPGNSMFKTLGNFAVQPRAGLTFVDFERHRQLQMTGDVRLDLRAGETSGETGGTGRWWMFSPRTWIVSTLSHSFDWTLIERSPYNP